MEMLQHKTGALAPSTARTYNTTIGKISNFANAIAAPIDWVEGFTLKEETYFLWGI